MRTSTTVRSGQGSMVDPQREMRIRTGLDPNGGGG
jgi:hypothetical protein